MQWKTLTYFTDTKRPRTETQQTMSNTESTDTYRSEVESPSAHTLCPVSGMGLHGPHSHNELPPTSPWSYARSPTLSDVLVFGFWRERKAFTGAPPFYTSHLVNKRFVELFKDATNQNGSTCPLRKCINVRVAPGGCGGGLSFDFTEILLSPKQRSEFTVSCIWLLFERCPCLKEELSSVGGLFIIVIIFKKCIHVPLLWMEDFQHRQK